MHFLKSFIATTTLFVAIGIFPIESFAAPAPSSGQEKVANLGSFKDPETGRNVHMVMSLASDAELRKFSPSRMASDSTAMKIHLRKTCGTGSLGEAAADLITSYPMESILFHSALALSAEEKIRNDPAALKHFYKQNLVDPTSHISFLMFMTMNRAAFAGMVAAGIAFDPCAEFFKVKSGERLQMEPNRLQTKWEPLVGPLSMGVGFLVSTAVQELLNDKNLQTCAKRLYTTFDPAENKAACDRFFEDWTMSRKIVQYAPDLFSMVSTSWIQAYLINKPLIFAAKKGGQALPKIIQASAVRLSETPGGTFIVKSAAGALASVDALGDTLLSFRAIQVAVGIGSWAGGPVTRAVVGLGQMVIFLGVNDWITHQVKPPWDRNVIGNRLADEKKDLQSGMDRAFTKNWDPAYVAPKMCETPDWMLLAARISPDSVKPPKAICHPDSIEKLISRVHDQYETWRLNSFSEAQEAQGEWQDYTVQFLNTYMDSFNFYRSVINSIRQESDSAIPASEKPLFLKKPYYGLSFSPVQNSLCELKENDLMRIRFAAQTARHELKSIESLSPFLTVNESGMLTPYQKKQFYLESILDGLEAMDCAIPLQDPRVALEKMKRDGRALSFASHEAMVERIRLYRMSDGLRTLFNVLTSDPTWNSKGVTNVDDPKFAELGDDNTFAVIASVIGFPDPLPVGAGYLKDYENNPAVINKDYKALHPSHIWRASTPTMTDYLLASMVCGPEAAPSGEVMIQMARPALIESRISKLSYLDRMMVRFGLETAEDPTTDRVFNAADVVTIEREYQKEASPQPRLFNFSEFRTSNVAVHTDYGLLNRVWGVHARFNPPSIIRGASVDFCKTFPHDHSFNTFFFDIHQADWNIGGKHYDGMLDIVKNLVRREIVGTTDKIGFFDWWSSHVDEHVKQTLDILKKNFKEVVDGKIVPALTTSRRGQYKTENLAFSPPSSLLDEAKWDLDILLKIYSSNKNAKDLNVLEFKAKQARLMRVLVLLMQFTASVDDLRDAVHMVLTTKIVGADSAHSQIALGESPAQSKQNGGLNPQAAKVNGHSDPIARASFESAKQLATMGIQQLVLQLQKDAAARKLPAPAQQNLNSVIDALGKNLLTLVTSYDAYFNMLNTVSLSRLDK
jgi:hypothetical protein